MPTTQERKKKASDAAEPASREYELSDDDREWVARVVESLGPLSREDREFLGLILRKYN